MSLPEPALAAPRAAGGRPKTPRPLATRVTVERPYEKHVFVCTYGPWCVLDGSRDVQQAVKRLVKDAGLRDVCRVNQSGCLNQCGHGPMVVVYPEGVWYDHVDVEKARRIVQEHVVAGRPVEELRYRPDHVGNNKLQHIREAEAKEKGKEKEKG